MNDEDVYLMLFLLAESVASRIRELASRYTVVEVCVRDAERQFFCRQRKLMNPTCSSAEIAGVAFELLQKNYHWGKRIRSIGVRGAGLIEMDSCVRISLYEDDRRRERWEQIDRTVDRLREQYGYMSVRRAVTMVDPLFGQINPKDNHTVHPVGYFGG